MPWSHVIGWRVARGDGATSGEQVCGNIRRGATAPEAALNFWYF